MAPDKMAPPASSAPSTSTMVPDDEFKDKEKGSPIPDAECLASSSDPDDVPLDREPEDHRDYPDGGYGWVIVICGFLLNFSTWGVNTAFGIYLAYDLENPRFKGARDIDFAFIGSLSLSLALAVAPFSNFLARTYHWRIPLMTGSVCVTAGQILAGFCTSIWQLYLTQGVLFAIGLGMTMVVSGPIVTQWFGLKRAFAVGIVSAGSGGGALFFSNITRLTLSHLDRRWACVINGCISAAGLIPAILFFKTRSTKLKVRFEPFQISFFKNPGFICMCFWGGFILFAYAIGIYTIPLYAVQGLGMTQKDGSTLQSLLAVGQIVGRPLSGYFLDKVGRFNGAIVTTLIASISCLAVWLVAQNFHVLAFAAFLQGASSGVFWSTCQALLTDLVGIRDMASALSVLWFSIVAPGIVSQPIAIWLTNYSRDTLHRTGTAAFQYGIVFAGVAFFASSVSLYGTKRYIQGDWKVFKRC
ncbi:uncharacterized protein CcaverHIS019_0108290 [Cutaneotrichosporon cavernicola]|uniref:Major facilitator superfamily (MFS) profile domain-containing protein n=1 Tax=Cutaneotrichosporon cavernicola TaxID=279322 RepID=A0AA48IC34_9TREE|nr:uncharacterized protein CcaverHIS019_0108290 [Cutaneotrichosporon cavernicola]BEI88111.1 hypothetical protein CcaverHIS019_0108290 [Cutaneotrichosporon cavernicola]BEI95882.1 hypothetical protein CcaverHIS631_0108310 [Cutaneotrichosporon cavernicola]BEJ03656.1 hypothetical protein CcaverHIS641_0108310 [Cutaneotrichosporon cavernicola]